MIKKILIIFFSVLAFLLVDINLASQINIKEKCNYINTNIYIEYVVFKFNDGCDKIILASSPKNIKEDIGISLDKFSFINLCFLVKEVNFIKYEIFCDDRSQVENKFLNFLLEKNNDGIDKNLINISKLKKDSLNLFYCFLIEENIAGLSSHPIISPGNYIFISSLHDRQPITFTHELGHYFGLFHTFDTGGDMCDDTPYEKIDECNLGTSKDPNQFNIMTYSKIESDLKVLYFTENQKTIVNNNLLLLNLEKQITDVINEKYLLVKKDSEFSLINLIEDSIKSIYAK